MPLLVAAMCGIQYGRDWHSGTMPQCSLLLKLAAESNENLSRSSQTKENSRIYVQRGLPLPCQQLRPLFFVFPTSYIEQLMKCIFCMLAKRLEVRDLANEIRIS